MIDRRANLKFLMINYINFILLLFFLYLNFVTFYDVRMTGMVESLLDYYAIIGIIMVTWTFLIIYKEQKEITLINIFLLMLYLMAYGQIWTRYFYMPILQAIDIFKYESHLSGLKAIAYSQVCCHFVFLIAYIKIVNKKQQPNILKNSKSIPFSSSNNNFILAGIILFSIGILPSLYNDGLTIVTSIRYGYSLSNVDRTGIWDDLAMFLRPAYFMLLVGLYNDKRSSLYKLVYYSAISWEALIMFFGGTRGFQITMIFALYWLDKKLRMGYVRFKAKEVFLAIAALTFLGLITAYRRTPASMWNINLILYSFISENYLIQMIAEFGSTLQTLIIAIDVIPRYSPFEYGLTYILAPIMMLPNIGNIVLNISKNVFTNNILRSFTNFSIGGSFIAELYHNFGQFGILFSGVFSIIISNISQITFFGEKSNKIKLVVSAGLMSTIPFLTRASLSELVRITIIRTLVPYILMIFITNKYPNNNSNNKALGLR